MLVILIRSILLKYKLSQKYKQNQSMRKGIRNRTIDIIQYDRGKRHFWTQKRGDYGFVSNFDLNRLEQGNTYQRPRRHSTLHNEFLNHDNENQQTYQKWLQIYKNQRQIPAKKQRQQELNNGAIEIKLPLINKKPQQFVKAYSYGINNDVQSYQNIDLGISRRKQSRNNQSSNQNIHKNQPQPEMRMSRHKRIATEGNRQYMKSERPKRNAKYSPTYVCSYHNPLPTFKLYDQGTGNARYQYGFTQL